FASAKLVVAEAMHGAIVADTLRIPWIAVECSPEILPFKWVDWCQSMDLPYKPFQLLPTSAWDAMKRRRVAASLPFRDSALHMTQDCSEVKDTLVRAFRERGHVLTRAAKSESELFHTARSSAIRAARFAGKLFNERYLDAAANQLTAISKEP